MANGAVVVEDLQRAAGNEAAERALFHLHNLVLAGGRRLLMTANAAPRTLGIRLPDLASRLEATATATLSPPDDALLAAVLVKLFADRQIAVPPALIAWLVVRIDRSFAVARALVAELDARALARRRPVTQKLAAEVLDSWNGAAP
jgi:chromosomal replication initiation ATPase DnaA